MLVMMVVVMVTIVMMKGKEGHDNFGNGLEPFVVAAKILQVVGHP